MTHPSICFFGHSYRTYLDDRSCTTYTILHNYPVQFYQHHVQGERMWYEVFWWLTCFAKLKTAPTQKRWHRMKEHCPVWFYNKKCSERPWSHGVICLDPQKRFLELWNWTSLPIYHSQYAICNKRYQTPLTLISIR